jgi:hypothetical protein
MIEWAKKTYHATVPLNGFHRMEDGRIFLKTSTPPSLMKAFQMNLIEAETISLDSTFNGYCLLSVVYKLLSCAFTLAVDRFLSCRGFLAL